MPKKENDLFQARIGNTKNKIFIDEYIKITQSRICDELGLSFCPKGLALYTLLRENAGNNGSMRGGILIPEYYNQNWIDERLKEFEIAKNGYVHQIRVLNEIFPDIMSREGDMDDLKEYEMFANRRDALLFCYDYFTKKIIPKVNEFNEKFQDGE